MAWYTSGTVSVTNGSAVVNGASTQFVDAGTLNAGDIFKAPDGKDYEVLSIQSNTQLTLAKNYLGATASGQAYAIVQIGMLPSALAARVKDTLSAANTAIAKANVFPHGQFYKQDSSSVAFTKTGTGTASIKAGTRVGVVGTEVVFAAATAITMPSLTAGTDYAIWVSDSGAIQASANFSAAPAAGNWRTIGGFHYAPGGNATANAGGNTTPQINEYSFWDLKFKPACQDQRGMALVAGKFWAAIYLTGVNHITAGVSAYSQTIADGSSPPKKPLSFGGDGIAAYTSLNRWEAAEVLAAYGLRLPTYDEFSELAFGTTEGASIGTDQGSTVWNPAYVSKWGCNQVAGVMWQWGADFGGGAAAAGWTANTGGRGSTYQLPNAALFGGSWGSGSSCGSRCSGWVNSPADSGSSFGARGCCDHLQLD